MKLFKCKERYKLILSWDAISYIDAETAILENPVFTGPALGLAAQIRDNDFIDLDITSQHVVLLKTWDIIRFSWNKVVSQTTEQALLDTGTLKSEELVKSRLFSNSDKLLIDTENHEEDVHDNNLVYTCVVVKDNNEVYDYSCKHSDEV